MERGGPAVCNVSFNREGEGEMTKAPITLQDLRRRLYVKAKAETSWRFWGLYVHICKMETLRQAYALAKENDARQCKGFGWKRWSRRSLYDTLKLFKGYKVRRPPPKVAPAG